MDSLGPVHSADLRRIRLLLACFILALALSGLSALPIPWGARLLHAWFGPGTWLASLWPGLGDWLHFVHTGASATASSYPFLFYGTDWLAFGHLAIALAFLGPLRDPVRNVWVIEFGIITCLGLLPWAFVFGALRGIPFFWQLIDCCFGVGGLLVLLPTYWLVRRQMRVAP